MTNLTEMVLIATSETFPDELYTILASIKDVSVKGDAYSVSKGFLLVERWKPSIVILGLPALDKFAIPILKRIKGLSAGTRVIILAPRFDEEDVSAVFDTGCTGFLGSESYADEIVQAVLAVTVGRHFLGYPLFERVIESYLAYGKKTKLISNFLH
jgi:DNA-binding NarL/FixJ family response regulator